MPDDLHRGQRLSKLHPVGGVSDRQLEATLGRGDRRDRDPEPLPLKIADREVEALVFFAEPVLDRHPAILKDQLGGV